MFPKTNLLLPKGKRGSGVRDKLEGWDELIHTHIPRHPVLYYLVFKTDNHQRPIVITQYSVITYKGKESEKEYIYMIESLAEHLKLK